MVFHFIEQLSDTKRTEFHSSWNSLLKHLGLTDKANIESELHIERKDSQTWISLCHFCLFVVFRIERKRISFLTTPTHAFTLNVFPTICNMNFRKRQESIRTEIFDLNIKQQICCHIFKIWLGFRNGTWKFFPETFMVRDEIKFGISLLWVHKTSTESVVRIFYFDISLEQCWMVLLHSFKQSLFRQIVSSTAHASVWISIIASFPSSCSFTHLYVPCGLPVGLIYCLVRGMEDVVQYKYN